MSLNWLLVFIPIAIGLDQYGAHPLLVFFTAAISIVPLTKLIGKATENLAVHLGDTLGGILNATMENVPEMVIGGFASRGDFIRS